MKEIAALGVAALIAAAGALWFTTRPALVSIETRELTVNEEMPTFKPLRP
jgi:hypothetical protein